MLVSALASLLFIISIGSAFASPEQAAKSKSTRVVCAADIPKNNPRCNRGHECIRNDEAADLICTLQFPNPNCLNGFCVKKHPKTSCGGFAGPKANPCPKPDQVCIASTEPECADCSGYCVTPQTKKK